MNVSRFASRSCVSISCSRLIAACLPRSHSAIADCLPRFVRYHTVQPPPATIAVAAASTM